MKVSTTDVKKMLIDVFSLEKTVDQIPDDSPIINEGLGLDSVDALEIIAHANRRFNAQIKGPEVRPEHFQNIRTLTDFINTNL